MAGKKRGMSLEDKRNTILCIFHDTKEVYLLKDIEKLASKRGVVLQSVKEVLQSLVDDDLVHGEKIGVSNYYWSFPSEAAVKLDAEISKLQSRTTVRQNEEETLQKELAKSKVGKEDSVRSFIILLSKKDRQKITYFFLFVYRRSVKICVGKSLSWNQKSRMPFKSSTTTLPTTLNDLKP